MSKLPDMRQIQVQLVAEDKSPDRELLLEIAQYFMSFADLFHHPKVDLIFSRLATRHPETPETVQALVSDHEERGRSRSFLECRPRFHAGRAPSVASEIGKTSTSACKPSSSRYVKARLGFAINASNTLTRHGGVAMLSMTRSQCLTGLPVGHERTSHATEPIDRFRAGTFACTHCRPRSVGGESG
jgi:hypothetical protein